MAGYGFAPNNIGGFGGGYLSNGLGAALGNANANGLKLSNAFREFQNSNMLDQYQIPAAEAGYDAAKNTSALNAFNGLVDYEAAQDAYNTPANQLSGAYMPGVTIPEPGVLPQDLSTAYLPNQNYMLPQQAPQALPAYQTQAAVSYANPQYGYGDFTNPLYQSQPSPLNYDPLQSAYYGGY